jgi:hypothetical protein
MHVENYKLLPRVYPFFDAASLLWRTEQGVAGQIVPKVRANYEGRLKEGK